MSKKYIRILAIVSTIAIIITCFIPWIHYNSINKTFNGINVTKFDTGVYYGKAGFIIIGVSILSMICTLIPKLFLKRINMFLSAFLFAYCIRTYILFTGSLFDGEVVKLSGIYLIIILSLMITVCSIFPNLEEEEN